MHPRVVLASLATVVAFAVHAQTAGPSVPDAAGASAQAPSITSRPSSPSTAATAGSIAAPADPAAAPRPATRMLGAGAFGEPPSAGLENVLNSGSPPMYQRGAGPRKVCPPELENRNNVCVPPIGAILTR